MQPIIVMGDFQDTPHPVTDTHPPEYVPTALWLNTIINNPYIQLIDLGNNRQKQQPTYTYYHNNSEHKSRKDIIFMTPELAEATIWHTNALWPVHDDHSCVACTIDFRKLETHLTTKPDHQLPPPIIAPHTSPLWKDYREDIINKLKNKPTESELNTDAKWTKLETSIQQSAEHAGIYEQRRTPPQILFPYEPKKMKKWTKIMTWCTLILGPTWTTQPPSLQQTAWTKIGQFLPRYLNPANQTHQKLPQRTQWDIEQLQLRIKQQIDTHTNKIANDTWKEFTKKINTTKL